MADVQLVIDGVTYTCTPQSSTPVPPVGPVFPAIPVNATKTVLDNLTNWAGEWDDATPNGGIDPSTKKAIPGATGSTKAVAGGREFLVSYKNRAGFRFHTHFADDDTSLNWVYDTTVTANWSQISRLELDNNQTLAGGKVVMMCVQAAAGGSLGSGSWELTFSNTPKSWNPSNVKLDISKWADGSTHRIRIKASRDANGVVAYEAVEVDGVCSEFAQPASTAPSIRPLGWTDKACLVNFQMEGSQASGSIQATASITMYRW